MLPDLCLRVSYSAHFASHCVNLHVIIYSYHHVTPSQNILAGICHLLSMLVLGALNYRHPPSMWTSSCQPNAGVYILPAFRGLASSNMARGRHEAAPAVSVGGAQVASGVPYTLLIFTPLQSSGVAVSIVVTLSLVSLFCPNFSWPTSFFSSYSFILRVTSLVAFSRIPIFPQFHYQH